MIVNIEYVTLDEIEAHKAAMQCMINDGEKEREAINNKKKRAIENANVIMEETVKVAEEKLRRAIEAANDQAERMLKQSRYDNDKKQVAKQRDFECLSLLRQVYHEAPDDVFELIVSMCSDGNGEGNLNDLRMVNKRCKIFAESCATSLISNHQGRDGPDSLPVSLDQRCRRIVEIKCWSRNLRSLEGCPNGLMRLSIGSAPHLSDLSPLSSCSMMESLNIYNSSITDISAVSSMPLLVTFSCMKDDPDIPSIKNLSPLSCCQRLKQLCLSGNRELKDLYPLSACTALEYLNLNRCPLVTSLAPLSTVKTLNHLNCFFNPQASLLPLASCTELKHLFCDKYAVGLQELRWRRQDVIINH